MSPGAIREAHVQLRQRGLRAREAAEALGLSEGEAIAAHVGLHPQALRDTLMEAAFEGTPVMVFVASPGCIQIHTGPVKRVETLAVHGKVWLNVLDPGFNLHLREDQVADVWVVEKPTEDGVVTSLEAFDRRGALMAMFFGARKPGQPERRAWRHILGHLSEASQPAVVP